MRKTQKERVVAYVETDLYHWLERQATMAGRSISSMIRFLVIRERERARLEKGVGDR